ncbi:unnamed protein product [Vicia faba]|uniref:Uncharacterized protein n=1 Tax=Vicia faba TaxID=3906 RepID=A0AAV1AWF4_VICFA|nr:unnamed protein product [Vicia faba]
MWKSLFGILITSDDDDKNEFPKISNTNVHDLFYWRTHSNELLKAPRADNNYENITTDHMKHLPYILNLVVSHILRPKNNGHSRVDQMEFHTIYILLHKIKINWKNYFVTRMFAIKKVNKGSFFYYAYMIAKIPKSFNIEVPTLLFIYPGTSQQFN